MVLCGDNMVLKCNNLYNHFLKGILGMFLIFLIVLVTAPGLTSNNVTDVVADFDESYSSDSDLTYQNSSDSSPIDVPGNSSKLQIQAGDLTRLRLRDQLHVNLTLQEHAELRINISDSNPIGPLPANAYQYKNFYQFELNKSVQLQANFSMPINKSELPEHTTPEMLQWAYFNTYTNSWEYVNSWLNEQKNMISTQTNHFSTWTILVNPDNSTVSTINSQGNGTAIKLQANQQYQIKLQSQFQINVSFTDDVEFSINETDSIPFSYTFENHYRYGNFWTLETNNSHVEFNATFGFPYDPLNIPSEANQEQLRFYFFNTTRNQWQLANSWTNTLQKMIFANTDHFSTWAVFGDGQSSKPIDPQKDSLNDIDANGTPMNIENGYTYRFRTQYGFELNDSLGQSAELSMNESNTNQYQNLIQNRKSIGKFLELELNETGIAIQATLAYKVASSEIPANVDPFKLEFAYFNITMNQWQTQNSWVVDIGSGYYMVYANTTHFSTWTILGSESTTTTPSTESTSQNAPGFELFTVLAIIVAIPFVKKRR